VAEPEINPTLARRELAVYFRRCREQHGLSLDDLAELLDVQQSQASRLDSGVRGFAVEDVRRLSARYGLGEGERGRLLELAANARKRAWWQQIDLPDSYRTLIGFEQAAESISEYCGGVVPGLLQTKDYAVAAVESSGIGRTSARAEQAVAVRMRRQEVLGRADPPELSVVIDEAVLARGAGGPPVMRDQFRRLLDLARRPRTSIQVLGFEAGLYPVGAAQFMILELGSRLPPVYFSEDQLSSQVSSEDDDLAQARQVWQRLQAAALSPVRSVERISTYLERLMN
jgi:transcriptional regulator with XRE-family HTH domain